MKQHIEVIQLNELSPQGFKALLTYLISKNYIAKELLINFEGKTLNKKIQKIIIQAIGGQLLLNIGQLIEFLDNFYKEFWSVGDYHKGGFAFIQGEGNIEEDMNILEIEPELCDALWKTTKKTLNKGGVK